MANTKTSKSASTKKATTKKTKDVEEKVNVIESAETAIGKLVTEDASLESAVNVEETEAEVKQSDEIVEDTGGIDLTKEDDVPVHVSAEEVKDFVFDKFSESSARQDEIVVPAPPVVVREKEVHVAKPLFPPSKYTQKTIVKKYH